MLKLGEPQKRVLATMATLECKLLSHRAAPSDRDDYDWTMYEGHRDVGPSVDVVVMLRDCRFLRLVSRSRYRTAVYELTSLGRAIAKELQDAQVE